MIAIQALTRKHPKDLKEDTQTGEIIWKENIDIQPGLAEILDKMTRYHFSQRYQSVDEVLSALNHIQTVYVDLISSARSLIGRLKSDPRIKSGGMVLPQVRDFLARHIENFENLYGEWQKNNQTTSFSLFMKEVCKETEFAVDTIHPAKLVLGPLEDGAQFIHSEESYQDILRNGYIKYKLESPKLIIDTAQQVIRKKDEIEGVGFAELEKVVSERLPDVDSESLANTLFAFWSAGCFETEPDKGHPRKRKWTLKPQYENDEEILDALRKGVRKKLSETFLEIDEEIDETVISSLLP